MKAQLWLVLGALLGGSAVVLGAFGAHLLSDLPPERLSNWETGARYHLAHAVALLVVGVLSLRVSSAWLQASGWCFVAGVGIFSGLLYVLAVSDVRVLGAVVPLGGLLMILGWLTLAIGAWRIRLPAESPSNMKDAAR